MRTFGCLSALAIFASYVAAVPTGTGASTPASTPLCMSPSDAQQVATNFRLLIYQYTEEHAKQVLTPNYTDYSSSVNTLINAGLKGPLPLLAPTFTNRTQFEVAQAAQPSTPFKQLNIWSTCSQVFLRWMSDIDPQPVVGLIVLEVLPAPAGNPYPFVIDLVYSEMNSGAWLVDMGIFTPNATSGATSAASSMISTATVTATTTVTATEPVTITESVTTTESSCGTNAPSGHGYDNAFAAAGHGGGH